MNTCRDTITNSAHEPAGSVFLPLVNLKSLVSNLNKPCMLHIEQSIESFSKRELGDIKVLMVEDDKFISNLVLQSLSVKGCIPYSCLTGEEAIQLAEQFNPDVIILDLMLPGMSGEDVLQTLKRTQSVKDIPVIVFSNKSEASDISNVLQLGAAKYLVKASTEILTIVDLVLELTKVKREQLSAV